MMELGGEALGKSLGYEGRPHKWDRRHVEETPESFLAPSIM